MVVPEVDEVARQQPRRVLTVASDIAPIGSMGAPALQRSATGVSGRLYVGGEGTAKSLACRGPPGLGTSKVNAGDCSATVVTVVHH